MGVGIMIIKNPSVENVVSKRELEIGTRIEHKEHKFSIPVSRKIAHDHIKEFPTYYTHKTLGLIAIEKRMRKLKG